MSLAEIKTAVETLSADEVAELAAFVRERENRAWDKQIDADFAEGGRLSAVAEEAREDIRAGHLQVCRDRQNQSSVLEAFRRATCKRAEASAREVRALEEPQFN